MSEHQRVLVELREEAGRVVVLIRGDKSVRVRVVCRPHVPEVLQFSPQEANILDECVKLLLPRNWQDWLDRDAWTKGEWFYEKLTPADLITKLYLNDAVSEMEAMRKEKMSMSLLRGPGELKLPEFFQFMIYGQQGAGKSTLAQSFPRPLLLDADNGVHRLRPEHRPQAVVQMESWKDAEALLDEDLKNFDSIIVDTVDVLLDMCMDDVMGNRTVKNMNDWGQRNTRFRAWLKALMKKKKHVCFVAHQIEDRDGDKKQVRPKLSDGPAGDIYNDLDALGYMYSDDPDDKRGGNRQNRVICFRPTDRFFAKNSIGKYQPESIPELGPGDSSTMMADMIEEIRISMRGDCKLKDDSDALVADFKVLCEAAQTHEELNNLVKILDETGHILDSKQRFTALMKEIVTPKRTALGLKFDVKNRVFIPEQPEA